MKKNEFRYIKDETSILKNCSFSVCCSFSFRLQKENEPKEMRFANRSRTTFITRFEETRLLTAIRCLNPRNTQMSARFRCCAALATEWWGNATLYLGHPHHSADRRPAESPPPYGIRFRDRRDVARNVSTLQDSISPVVFSNSPSNSSGNNRLFSERRHFQ